MFYWYSLGELPRANNRSPSRLKDGSSLFVNFQPFSNSTANVGRYQYTPGQVRCAYQECTVVQFLNCVSKCLFPICRACCWKTDSACEWVEHQQMVARVGWDFSRLYIWPTGGSPGCTVEIVKSAGKRLCGKRRPTPDCILRRTACRAQLPAAAWRGLVYAPERNPHAKLKILAIWLHYPY
jgi:hypothetical protein